MGIKLLDCTLRDGAYINESMFGKPAIQGIIKKLQDAHIEIIECGWLKDKEYEDGSTFYHVPGDLEPYILNRGNGLTYCAMIDWDRYNVDALPVCDGKSINAIRVVFPHSKHKEGIKVGRKVREKGYKVFFQAANTLAYSNEELMELADDINEFGPVALSVVDTFGAMYFEDLDRIIDVLDARLDKRIQLGFHAHNNQQLAFALSIEFINKLHDRRNIILDATLSGMGRGAGNATTELVTSYVNKKENGSYDMNAVMDAIDTYMQGFQEKYTWGYSTPYFIAGVYQCHVNNIAYLMKNHRTNAKDMRNIIESLSVNERRKYDYDLLEERYLENQNRIVNDEAVVDRLREKIKNQKVLLIAPGKSIIEENDKIQRFIKEEHPVVIAVNAINKLYDCEYAFFTNVVRYEYARNAYPLEFKKHKKILLSNIKVNALDDECIINFNSVIERGWEHFDNAVILCLRLLNRLNADYVYIAGFDGFKTRYNESYADGSLPTLNPDNKWDELNREIVAMYKSLHDSIKDKVKVEFLTESIFDVKE